MTNLPDFPFPELPETAPENYGTLKVRVMRRLGLPDDGLLYISDAIDPEILREFNGIVSNETRCILTLQFAFLSDAVAWAEGITETGRDREMISFATGITTPYQPATIYVWIGIHVWIGE